MKPTRVLLAGAAGVICATSLLGACGNWKANEVLDKVQTIDITPSPAQTPSATLPSNPPSSQPATPGPTPTQTQTEPTASATPTQTTVEKPTPISGDGVTIALVGSDTRDGANGKLVGGAKGPGRSDTTMIAHIDADGQTAWLVSIPRDTLVNLPQCAGGGSGKINTAYSAGGPACTVQALRDLTGLRIDHLIDIDFAGFAKTIDSIGGIDICLTDPIQDPYTHVNYQAGKHHLNGKQALALARLRHGTADGSDISRMTRQQQIMRTIYKKLLGQISNPQQAYQMANQLAEYVTMDTELANTQTLADLALRAAGVETIHTLTMPWDPAGDGANVVEAPEAQNLWDAIATDGPLPRGLKTSTKPSKSNCLNTR